jgi:hypothetical protein
MTSIRSDSPDETLAPPTRQQAAYEQGRSDVKAGVSEHALLQDRDTVVRHAYERGRRDERARHSRKRGSPVLTTVLLLAAAAGVFVIYLGVSQGSFGRGGQMVDQSISNAAASAMNVVHRTTQQAGDALQNAGQRLKQTGGSGS